MANKHRAVSKTHINISMNGDEVVERYSEVNGEATISGVEQYIAPAYQTHRVFKLVDNKKKGGIGRPCIEDVINPATNKREKMRVLRGVPSIWFKDQKDYDKDYVRGNLRSIRFENRFLRIALDDAQMIEFIERSKYFIPDLKNNKKTEPSQFDFYEYDPEKQAAEALEKEMKEMEMVAQASTTPIEIMEKHFIYLGGNLIDELGRKKSEGAIRREYMLQAKRRTDVFEKSYNSKEAEVNFQVRKALIENLIDLGKTPNSAYWGTGAFITKIPQGKKANEYLTSFALSNTDNGNTFLEQLNNIK